MNIARKTVAVGAVVGASLAGGALGASLVGTAGAQSAPTTPTTSTDSGSGGGSSDGSGTAARPGMPAHGRAEHESQETPVTGADDTRAQDAAVKSVGGGTAGEVTSDLTKDGYEVTVTKADGSQVEVHLDSSFGVRQGTGGQGPGGHGPGGHGPGHGHGHGPADPNDQDGPQGQGGD